MHFSPHRSIHSHRSRSRWRGIHFLILGAAVFWSTDAKADDGVRIFDHGAVSNLSFASAAQRAASAGSPAERLTFDALGRHFDVVLRENTGLLSELPAKTRDRVGGGLEVYAGELDGVAGSWVRLTRQGQRLSGLIYDGEELFALEPAAGLAGASGALAASARGLALYRTRDLELTGACALDSSNPRSFGFEALSQELRALAPTLGAATAQLNVAVVLDREFVLANADPEATAVSLLNAVDGLYSDQVGLSVRISELRSLADNGNLTSSNASTLLNQLSNLSASNALDNPGLVHLLTGKGLNGGTIGIAFLDTMCSERLGVALSELQRGSLAATTVLIAHEIGHNVGAPHDDQGGSPCVNTPSGFIMNPFLNGGSEQFSQCSLDQMAPSIAAASCLVDLPDAPEPPVEPPDPTAACLFSSSFDADAAGFVFVPDAETPAFTSGALAVGSLEARVGNVNNDDVVDMTGRFARVCTQDEAADVTVTVQARMTQAPNYEADERSELALRVNGVRTVLAEVVGNGNGGAAIDTGLATFTVDAALPVGISNLELECANSKKTFQDELTTCQFTAVEVAASVAPPPPPPNPDAGLSLDFEDGPGPFAFESDPDADAAPFSAGAHAANVGVAGSGGLRVDLGGVDDSDIVNMTGIWSTPFGTTGTTGTTAPVELTVSASVTQSANYEFNELSVVGVLVDGVFTEFARVRGNGNGGGPRTTGFQTFTLDLDLAPGTHTLGLVCFNNLKTFRDEVTTCAFDDLELR